MSRRLIQRTFVDKLGRKRRPRKRFLGQPIYDYGTQCKYIGEMIEADGPMSILRPGNCEFVSVWEYDENQFYGGGRYRKLGIFKNLDGDEEAFEKWVSQFKQDMSEADGVVLFNPTDYMEEYLARAYYRPQHFFLMPLLEFNPFVAKTEHSWVEKLIGKTVLIVSLFADTMEKQVPYMDKIWPGINPVPNVNFIFQKALWHVEGSDNKFNTWFEALDYLDNQVQQKEFDIAIISCGPFSTFLAANIKRRGGKAIQYGGALQLLFGIRGNRWENMPISQYFNEYWVRPSEEETPKGAERVEGACYW